MNDNFAQCSNKHNFKRFLILAQEKNINNYSTLTNNWSLWGQKRI